MSRFACAEHVVCALVRAESTLSGGAFKLTRSAEELLLLLSLVLLGHETKDESTLDTFNWLYGRRIRGLVSCRVAWLAHCSKALLAHMLWMQRANWIKRTAGLMGCHTCRPIQIHSLCICKVILKLALQEEVVLVGVTGSDLQSGPALLIAVECLRLSRVHLVDQLA